MESKKVESEKQKRRKWKSDK